MIILMATGLMAIAMLAVMSVNNQPEAELALVVPVVGSEVNQPQEFPVFMNWGPPQFALPSARIEKFRPRAPEGVSMVLDVTNDGIKGRLEYEQTVTCTRCLVPTAVPVSSEVELLLARGGEGPEAAELELEQSDLSVLLIEENSLDTQPILLEQLQLNVPMRALCREDCAGLCPICGTNRNTGSCTCEDEETDPRWSALEDLRKGI